MPEMLHKGRLTLLGTFRLQAPDGADCTIPASKQCGLIAVLALAPGGQLSHERAMALLRTGVAPLGHDRYLADDLRFAAALVTSGRLAEAAGVADLPTVDTGGPAGTRG